MTPPELLAYRDDASQANTPGWTLRVVPNKFPAVISKGIVNLQAEGIYQSLDGLGAHEVIIETPQHEVSMARLSDSQFLHILRAYRERALAVGQDKRLRHVLIFKNQGAGAGTTLEHTHSQLLALPIVPQIINEELAGAREYYEREKQCIFCHLIQQESEERARVVAESEDFIVICPFAPRVAFEIWLLPKRHAPRFEHATELEHAGLAFALRQTLVQLKRALDDPPLNYIIHSNQLDEIGNDFYHWHIEILPRLTQLAGFEWGSGYYINSVAPEDAVRVLREALP
jgi:UDPglucose--hexose-1-phosphate uridylyltransferase